MLMLILGMLVNREDDNGSYVFTNLEGIRIQKSLLFLLLLGVEDSENFWFFKVAPRLGLSSRNQQTDWALS